MSEKPARNTQFAGFAKALLADIDKATDDFCKDKDHQYTDEYEEKIVTLVAQKAYDLVAHTIRSQAQGMELFVIHDSEWMQERIERIPDMLELPGED